MYKDHLMTYNGWYAIKTNETKSYIFLIYIYIYIYIYKDDLALNKQQRLACHNTYPTKLFLFAQIHLENARMNLFFP